MFPNLKAEMTRWGVTTWDIAQVIGKSRSWVETRLQGKTVMPVTEAIVIREAFFPDASIEYLFATKPITGGARDDL